MSQIVKVQVFQTLNQVMEEGSAKLLIMIHGFVILSKLLEIAKGSILIVDDRGFQLGGSDFGTKLRKMSFDFDDVGVFQILDLHFGFVLRVDFFVVFNVREDLHSVRVGLTRSDFNFIDGVGSNKKGSDDFGLVFGCHW